MFGPEAAYERVGDVSDVVFPCGQTVGADGDSINLYYGAADSSIAMATGSIRSLLSWLDSNSGEEERMTRVSDRGYASTVDLPPGTQEGRTRNCDRGRGARIED